METTPYKRGWNCGYLQEYPGSKKGRGKQNGCGSSRAEDQLEWLRGEREGRKRRFQEAKLDELYPEAYAVGMEFGKVVDVDYRAADEFSFAAYNKGKDVRRKTYVDEAYAWNLGVYQTRSPMAPWLAPLHV